MKKIKNKTFKLFFYIMICIVFLFFTLELFAKGEKWIELQSFNFDINRDGLNERITLISNVERLNDGQLLWDDGQIWKLVVKNKKGRKVLFKEYLTLGKIYISIGVNSSEKKPSIVVVKDEDSAFTVLSYKYNIKTGIYDKKIIFSSEKKIPSAVGSY